MTAANPSPTLAPISTSFHRPNHHRSPSSSSSSSTISSSASSRSPSPPLHHSHRPHISSPLSSPSMSPLPIESSYFPSANSPTTASSFQTSATSSSSLASSGGGGPKSPRRASQPSLFPRSQPLRPMVAMTSINKPSVGLGISTNGSPRRKSASELEEEKYKTPINGTGGSRKGSIGGGALKKGGVKLLVSKRMQTTFELNLNCRELSRAESN